MKPGRTTAAGSPAPAMVVQHQGLGLGLRSGVGVERIGGRRRRLVGPVVVAAFVDAQRADVHQPLDPGLAGGVEQETEGLDVEPPELLETTPIPHLGGAVEDPVSPGGAGAEGLRIFQVADDPLDAPLVEPSRVAGGSHQGPDAMAALQGLLGGMTADQAGRPGDEDDLGRTGLHDVSQPCGISLRSPSHDDRPPW